jgi:hypothetical protein
MNRLPKTLILSGLALAMMPAAAALASNLTLAAFGETRDEAIATAKHDLEANCKAREGKPLPDTFEIVFEKALSNGKYMIDAQMQCELP